MRTNGQNAAKICEYEPQKLKSVECSTREATEIEFHLQNMNREEGFSVGRSWWSLSFKIWRNERASLYGHLL